MTDFDRHCAEVITQTTLLTEYLDGADLGQPAPTCPGWNVSQLLRHVDGGLRWATEIVGTRATELIQELVNAKALEGGYPEVARIIHGHPTLSEAVMEAARAADGWVIHG